MNVLTPTLGSLLACLALISCGGGELDASAVAAVLPGPAVAQAPAQVPLEGCVVDADGRPAVQAVQASLPDGRRVASAMSDAGGVFRMHVPAREVLRVETVAGVHDGLTLMTGNGATLLGGCLRA